MKNSKRNQNNFFWDAMENSFSSKTPIKKTKLFIGSVDPLSDESFFLNLFDHRVSWTSRVGLYKQPIPRISEIYGPHKGENDENE